VEEYTKENRKKMYLDMISWKRKDLRKNPQKYEEKIDSKMFKQDGENRQCNEVLFI